MELSAVDCGLSQRCECHGIFARRINIARGIAASVARRRAVTHRGGARASARMSRINSGARHRSRSRRHGNAVADGVLRERGRAFTAPSVRTLPPQATGRRATRSSPRGRSSRDRKFRGRTHHSSGHRRSRSESRSTDERAVEARTRFHRGCRAAVAARQAAAQILNSKTERIEE